MTDVKYVSAAAFCTTLEVYQVKLEQKQKL